MLINIFHFTTFLAKQHASRQRYRGEILASVTGIFTDSRLIAQP